MTRISEEQLAKLLSGNPHVSMAETYTASSKPRANKYNAQPTAIDGLQFDSKAEAKRYQTLRLLERIGEIRNLTVQPSYILQHDFTDEQGRKHRSITYTADFRYERDGQTIVEDVKGGKATQTAAFRIKWKLAIKKYPLIQFEIVDGSDT